MSDHFSSLRAMAEPAADICDLYAFPSPQQPGRLVLVMDVFPSAGPTAFFSDAITYRFRLRPVTIAATGPAAAFAVATDEHVFDCTFAEPIAQDGNAGLVQTGACRMPTGETVSITVNDERASHVNGTRVFAGFRSDPFFLDILGAGRALKERRLAFTGLFLGLGSNVLSVVLEFDCGVLRPADTSPLFGVVGETVVTGKLPICLERVGRPEVKNITLLPKDFDTVNRDLDIRDLYNMEDAFHLGHGYLGAYRARFNANLAFYDSLDGKMDWPLSARGAHPLTELLLADFLVVDLSKPFSEESYFEIEQSMLRGRAHTTCGGRWLNDDIVDTYYTLLINAGNGPRIRDGVDQSTVPASRAFPYLAPANSPEVSQAFLRNHPAELKEAQALLLS